MVGAGRVVFMFVPVHWNYQSGFGVYTRHVLSGLLAYYSEARLDDVPYDSTTAFGHATAIGVLASWDQGPTTWPVRNRTQFGT